MNIDPEIKLPDPWAVCRYCGLYVHLCHCRGMWKHDDRLINERAADALKREQMAMLANAIRDRYIPLRPEDV